MITWPGRFARTLGSPDRGSISAVKSPWVAVAGRTALMRRRLSGPDFREGVQAFKEKRPPEVRLSLSTRDTWIAA